MLLAPSQRSSEPFQNLDSASLIVRVPVLPLTSCLVKILAYPATVFFNFWSANCGNILNSLEGIREGNQEKPARKVSRLKFAVLVPVLLLQNF